MASKTGPHICQHCGDDFMGWNGNPNNYCSRECTNEANKTDYGHIECEICGKELTHEQKKKYTLNKEYYERKGESYGKPHCSVECARESKRVPKVERICKECGSKFYKRKWSVKNHNRGHFCSQSCNAKYYARKRSDKARVDCECQRCGEIFTELKVYVENYGCGKYCSDKCKRLASRNRVKCECANCGKEFEKVEAQTAEYRGGATGKNYCSKSCWYLADRRYDTILTTEEYQRFKEKANRKIIHHEYVKKLLWSEGKLRFKDIPESLVKAKRQHLKIHRKIKDKTQ